jgi:predicted RND superfamily exporter protein
MISMDIIKLYCKFISFPKTILALITLSSLLAVTQLQHFTFDASSDTLVVKGDPKLADYNQMAKLFGGDEFIVFTYAPLAPDHLLSEKSLTLLSTIQAELNQLNGVSGTFSILDAPLVRSPAIDLNDMSTGYRTLRSPDVDKPLAVIELTTSSLFEDFLISADGGASAIRIDLKKELELNIIRSRRDELRLQTGSTDTALIAIEAEYVKARTNYVARRELLIAEIRTIRDKYQSKADIFISGVPMIAADMITFVKSDLSRFGTLVLGLIIAMLYLFFRRWRWVMLPLLIAGVSLLFTTGILGFMQKPVTVVSSNFISLLAIICISFSIHLIVRYRELLAKDEELDHKTLIENTLISKFLPCLYTGLTTLLAFGSMFASNIVPIEDFGWMMCLGIIISFLVTYSLFPAVLLILSKAKPSHTLNQEIRLTNWLCELATMQPKRVVFFSLLLAFFSITGLSLVTFDNRFIDYFDEDTDIHQGMKYIDDHLGGTVPFDVYLQFNPFDDPSKDVATPDILDYEEEDDFFASDDVYPERYWFTVDRIETVAKLHKLITQQPNIGKVISISTLEKMGREFNENEPLSALELAYVIGELPESIRNQLIAPYANPERGIARINVRVKESGERFSRDKMVSEIERFATVELGLEPENVKVTGMMVLFNEMLKQLADSQLRTLLYLVLATFLMFSLLLRSLLLAILALTPNILAAATIIAFMGYASIPMDMMTITIAAISIGIGVDDAIHYLHRFRKELSNSTDTITAVKHTHSTIGRAMYFTSMIIIGGFSILTLSNFLPTVYFGLLTALAMILALLANLTLLPSLLVLVYRTAPAEPS